MKLLTLGVISVILGACSARTVRQNQRAHFLGDGSNDVAVNILQSIVGKEKNAVFSPLGYTTILAILTEGARENTRNQLVASLKLPEDTYAVRSTYKRVLTEMSAHDMLNKPEFKNWFYVYKNYTVEESYRSILRDYYLTEVKEVDRYDFPDEDETKKEKPLETGTVTQGESMKNSSLAESLQQVESDESKEDDSKEKSESKEKGSSEEKNSKEKDSAEDKDSSEEKNVKKPSNVMKIKEKVKPIESKDKSPAPISAVQVTDKPEMTESPKESSDGQTEVTTQPDEDSSQQQGASSYPKLDVRSARDTSALSANRLSTMDSERESSLKKLSRMMVFNALYFKGNWSKRFKRTTDKLYPFKVSKTEEKNIEYLQAEDEFETGRIPELDAQALDIPYQGERYSVLVLVPSEEDGLEGLLKKLPGFSFYNIDKQMTKLPTKVCIPKLKFYTISRPTDAFIKSGITDIFNQNADLSGISGKPGLFLEELVQLVTFELDETDSSFNYLTTTEVSELRATPISFKADRPFVFFLRDKVENLNIVSGIVTDPSLQSGGKSSQASNTAN